MSEQLYACACGEFYDKVHHPDCPALRQFAALKAENAELRKLTELPIFEEHARLERELSTLRESMRAGSLLRKVGEPIPKGCYCTLGKCTAPRPEWCRDSEKRDYKPPEDSNDE